MNTAHKPKADFDQRYQTHLKHWRSAALAMNSVLCRIPAACATARIASTLKASAGLSGKLGRWWRAAIS